MQIYYHFNLIIKNVLKKRKNRNYNQLKINFDKIV